MPGRNLFMGCHLFVTCAFSTLSFIRILINDFSGKLLSRFFRQWQRAYRIDERSLQWQRSSFYLSEQQKVRIYFIYWMKKSRACMRSDKCVSCLRILLLDFPTAYNFYHHTYDFTITSTEVYCKEIRTTFNPFILNSLNVNFNVQQINWLVSIWWQLWRLINQCRKLVRSNSLRRLSLHVLKTTKQRYMLFL